MSETDRTAAPGSGPALGEPAPVPRGSLRDRIRAQPGLREVYRVAVFGTGLLLIALGIGLAALPGPLTIPPILAGLWIWATEFRFARRLLDRFKVRADQAWTHAKAHPVSSAAITIGGLLAAGAVFWAVQHFGLVGRARDLVL